jgi:hypothetical protein
MIEQEPSTFCVNHIRTRSSQSLCDKGPLLCFAKGKGRGMELDEFHVG